MGEALLDRTEGGVDSGQEPIVILEVPRQKDPNVVERQRLEQDLSALSRSREERIKSIEIVQRSMFLASLPRIDDENEMYSTQSIDSQIAVVRQRIVALTIETDPETIK